eukprot:6446898-Ditylum_brightwellii.AAC.1
MCHCQHSTGLCPAPLVCMHTVQTTFIITGSNNHLADYISCHAHLPSANLLSALHHHYPQITSQSYCPLLYKMKHMLASIVYNKQYTLELYNPTPPPMAPIGISGASSAHGSRSHLPCSTSLIPSPPSTVCRMCQMWIHG